MNQRRLLLDTVIIQALLNRRDQYYQQARAVLPTVRSADEVWVTEAVLTEVGNALSVIHRSATAQFIEQCYHTANMRVVNVNSDLLLRALCLYKERSDKDWGMTDCISFVVMREQCLIEAVTADRHFVQAGFRALLLEV